MLAKITSLVALCIAFTSLAHATVDGHDSAYIVVQNIQDSEDFLVQKAPIVGCWGMAQSPRLEQWTHQYLATANIGCGGTPVSENINYLTCAKVIDSKESADYMAFSEITLDISKCDQKDNPKFITMVRTSAKLNFPQTDKKTEVTLNLIK